MGLFKGQWLHSYFLAGYFPALALNKLLRHGGVAEAKLFTEYELRRLKRFFYCRCFWTGGKRMVEATAKTWMELKRDSEHRALKKEGSERC